MGRTNSPGESLRAIAELSDRWLTAYEVAGYLAVTIKCLDKWRLKGGGPKFTVSFGSPRYRLSDVVAFMEAGLVENTTQARQRRAERPVDPHHRVRA
jgi:uncharacterized protein YodC (DUF2158 family)